MIEKFTYGVHLVRVTTDERENQLWAAATPREQAVRLVLNAIPEGRTIAAAQKQRLPYRDPAYAVTKLLHIGGLY